MLPHEFVHISLSLIVALVGYRYYRSIWVWAASYALGFFVDADHLIDYFIYRKGLHFDPTEFASGSYFDKTSRIFLFLHSYEIALVLIIMAAILFFKNKSRKSHATVILFVLAASLTLHLLYDTIYYKPDWNTYFLSSRAAHHFNLNDFHFH